METVPRLAEGEPLALGPIGVGFDGSTEASGALHIAAGLARTADCAVVATAVHERIAFEHLPVAADRALVSLGRRRKADLAERLNTAVEELGMGNQATATLREGHPVSARPGERRARAAHRGSRGYGPIGAVLLGSVATRVLARAACPVMVVPRGAGERLRALTHMRDRT